MTNTTEMNVTVSAPADVKTTRLECDGKLNLTPVSAPVDVKTTKPTKKALFTALLALVTETAPENAEILTAFINNEIALLDKRTANKTASKTQVENENIKAKILDALTEIDKPVTISELQTLTPELAIYTNQKLSALLKKLVESGEVVKTTEKKKSYFAVAETEGE